MTSLVDFPVKPEARPYLDVARVDSGEPEWLRSHRRRALARFAERGFPSRRSEAWRYLDLRTLEEAPLLPAATGPRQQPAAARALLTGVALAPVATRLILVDGCFSPVLSTLAALPAGVVLRSSRAAIDALPELVRPALKALSDDPDQPFAALNAAIFSDGFVLDVAPGAVAEEPIEIVHLASGEFSASLHTRSLVSLGAGSHVRLIETFVGDGRSWRNDVVSMQLADGAVLDRIAVIEEADSAIHFGATSASLGAAARLTSFDLLLGGATVRRETIVRSAGEGAYCGLYGAFLASARQQANVVTSVEHSAPRGETREVFKGVAAGRAHGAFQGRIAVRPGAQKVDAHMLSRNLLLGTRAAIDTKPELEIFADDVRCGHGAAVGDLDEAALFYLLARGIPRHEARRMLIEAFLREAVETVDHTALREHLLGRLAGRLTALEE